MISWNGPIVNAKFNREITEHCGDKIFNMLIDIGTCNLHVIHGSSKNVVVK